MKEFRNQIIMSGNIVSTIKASVQYGLNQILHFKAFLNSTLQKSDYVAIKPANNNTKQEL